MFDTKKLFSKIFMWLFVGLMVTFSVGMLVQTNENMMFNILKGNSYLVLCIIEIAIGFLLSLGIRKLPPIVTGVLYLLYAALTGFTFAIIFLVYTVTSIMWILLVSAMAFLILGLIGYYTNIDLSKFRSILFIGLIAVILLSIISLFIPGLDFATAIISLLIFLGYVAYDFNCIKKQLYNIEDINSYAIYGAFQLYLDLINIIIDLLRIFGKEK